MRELKDGPCTLSIRIAGRVAPMTLQSGEQITEHTYRAVEAADRKRFKRLADATATTASTPAAEADQPTP